MVAESSSRVVADDTTIPHAYALVPVPGKPGHYHALHLEGVIAEKVTDLTPDAKTTAPVRGMERIFDAMNRRHRAKKWGRT